MNSFGLTFHHLGLAVARPRHAITFLTGLGYSIGPEVVDPLQNVRLMMCTQPAFPSVEIITPNGTNDSGPVSEYTRKNPFGLVYHSCYVTQNLDGTLAAWKEAGLRVMCAAEPKPAVLFDGRKVSFYMVSGTGLVELLE